MVSFYVCLLHSDASGTGRTAGEITSVTKITPLLQRDGTGREAFFRYTERKSGLELTLPQLEKLTAGSGIIRDIAHSGLNHNGAVVEADDRTPGMNDMIVLKYPDPDLAIHRFLKIPIGQKPAVDGRHGQASFSVKSHFSIVPRYSR
jgi:hypothetical protein